MREGFGVLTETGAGLVGGILCAAEADVVAHVGAAHVEFDDVCAGVFKSLGHVNPSLYSGFVADVRDVGHDEEVGAAFFTALCDEFESVFDAEAAFCAEGEEFLVRPPAVARVETDVRGGVEGEFDAGAGPSRLVGLDEVSD